MYRLRLVILALMVVLAYGSCARKDSPPRVSNGQVPEPMERPENAVIIGNRTDKEDSGAVREGTGDSIAGSNLDENQDWLFATSVPARDRDLGALYSGEPEWAEAVLDLRRFFDAVSKGNGITPYVVSASATVLDEQSADIPQEDFRVRVGDPVADGDRLILRVKLLSKGFSTGEAILEQDSSGQWRVSALDLDASGLDEAQDRDRFDPASYGDVLPYL